MDSLLTVWTFSALIIASNCYSFGPLPPPNTFRQTFIRSTAGFPVPSISGGYGPIPGPGVTFSPGPGAIFPGGSNCQLKIKCQPIQTAPGVYDFNCAMANPCKIQREDILWLKNNPEPQQLNVVVPNYKFEEVIKAAFKSEPVPGSQVNILLKRPHYTVEAEHQAIFAPLHPPEVNLQYEPTPPKELIHYPVHKPYRVLSSPILEPGQPGLGANFHSF